MYSAYVQFPPWNVALSSTRFQKNRCSTDWSPSLQIVREPGEGRRVRRVETMEETREATSEPTDWRVIFDMSTPSRVGTAKRDWRRPVSAARPTQM